MRSIFSTTLALCAVFTITAAANAASDPSTPIQVDPHRAYPLYQPDPPATIARSSSTTSANTQSATGGATPQNLASGRYFIYVNDSDGNPYGYARARNDVAGLVIGDAAWGWTFDVSQSTASWAGGYLYGHMNTCGWVLSANVFPVVDPPNPHCAGGSTTSNTSIGAWWNARANCDVVTGACDGSGTHVSCSSVQEWGNVKPWNNPSSSPTELIRTIDNTSGHNYLLYWRYLTRDGTWVMAHDTHFPDTDGNWVFVASSCFSSLPNAVPMTG